MSMKGLKHSEETKKKLSLKMSQVLKGVKRKPFTAEHKKKLSEGKRGSKCHLWSGGVTKENKLIRSGYEYREWRMMVFGRDNFTCQECGKRGCYLNAHHIKHFAKHPELRFEVDNGITLCKECHKLKHKRRLK